MILRMLMLILLALLVAAFPASQPVSARQSTQPCAPDSPLADDLPSAAVGLTREELDALYGPGEAVQTGWLYQFAGFDL